jgi:hypothetical protein
MQLRDRFPVDTVTGGDFISGSYDPAEGVIDLDLDVETMPAFGRLCTTPKGVRLLMQQLGWEQPTENVVLANARLRAENKELRRELTSLYDALRPLMAIQAQFPADLVDA